MEPPSAEWFRPKHREPSSQPISFRPPRARPQPDRELEVEGEGPSAQWFRRGARERRAEAAGLGGPPPRSVSDRRLALALVAFGLFVLGAMVLFASRGWVP